MQHRAQADTVTGARTQPIETILVQLQHETPKCMSSGKSAATLNGVSKASSTVQNDIVAILVVSHTSFTPQIKATLM